MFFFFFQAEDGIRDLTVTGVQTCALPISAGGAKRVAWAGNDRRGTVQEAARLRAAAGRADGDLAGAFGAAFAVGFATAFAAGFSARLSVVFGAGFFVGFWAFFCGVLCPALPGLFTP